MTTIFDGNATVDLVAKVQELLTSKINKNSDKLKEIEEEATKIRNQHQ